MRNSKRAVVRALQVGVLLLPMACGGRGGGGGDDRPSRVRVEVLESSLDVLRLRIRFPEADTQRRTEGGMDWIALEIADCASDGAPAGHPDVPAWGGLLAVPIGARAVISSFETRPSRTVAGRLYPSQPFAQEPSPDIDLFLDDVPPPIELYDGAPFAFDPAAYVGGPGPAVPVALLELGDLRGLAVAGLRCSCGQYEPAADETTLFESVDIAITFEGGERAFVPAVARNGFERYPGLPGGSLLNHDIVWDHVDAGVIERFCPGEELLILTAPRFRPQADTLAAWRDQHGVPTSVVEVADEDGPGPDTAQEIDAFLDDRFESCFVRFSYVLILGDSDDVPTFTMQRLLKDPGVMIATDYPYATYATAPTAQDLMPDFAVGRISAESEAQMDVVIAKIIAYDEDSPAAPPSFYSVALPAFFECCNPNAPDEGTEAGRDFITKAEYFRERFLVAGHASDRLYSTNANYWTPEYMGDPTPRRHPNGDLLPQVLQPPFPWDADAAAVAATLNAGRFLCLHLDHGNEGGWGDPPFTKSSVTNLLTNGDLLPVLLAENCSNGHFDGTDCFAEHILRHEDGGAVGVYAWTRMCNTLYFRAVVRGTMGAFWGSTFPEWGDGTIRHRLGDAHLAALLRLVAEHAGADPTTDAYLNAVNHIRIYTLFGDPTLEIRTKSPLEFEPDFEIEVNPDFLHIVYGEEGAQLTALQLDRGVIVPIGRGLVEDGVADLTFANPLVVGVPIQLFASGPDQHVLRLQ